jgi:hypothetical protein
VPCKTFTFSNFSVRSSCRPKSGARDTISATFNCSGCTERLPKSLSEHRGGRVESTSAFSVDNRFTVADSGFDRRLPQGKRIPPRPGYTRGQKVAKQRPSAYNAFTRKIAENYRAEGRTIAFKEFSKELSEKLKRMSKEGQ